MLSICIPIFNLEVSELVSMLDEQSKSIGIPYEIVLIDDCSKPEFKLKNKDLNKLESIIYIELEKNIGRSAIRNLFLKYSQYENLLFLDCDSQVTDNLFVANYIKHCDITEKVICGGTKYPTKPKNNQSPLRWKFGVNRECIPAEKRDKNPYQSFMSNNFLIKRSILDKIKFEEKLEGYGHEDSLLGYSLKQNKVPLMHINNPVIHDFSETDQEFLCKTKQALRNLYFINSEMDLGADFSDMIKLLKVYSRIKKMGMKFPAFILILILKPLICISFNTGILSLIALDVYKLGYYLGLLWRSKR